MIRPHEHLRPVPPYLAQDSRATAAIVLVVGEWLDSRGRVVGYQVVPSTQHRRVLDIAPLPPVPAFELAEESR
jgi:hypothetical protein